MKRRLVIISLAAALPMVAAGGVYARRDHAAPEVITAPVTRGPIVSAIAATGTVEAVTTVEVGRQVTATIQSLGADFNSIVKKGQVLVRLDPSVMQSTVEQARANLERSTADVDRLRVALADADRKLSRARDLSARQLIPATDLEDAVVARRNGVLRVPASALRFRPTPDVMKAFDGTADISIANTRAAGSTIWKLVAGRLDPVAVTTGATDGAVTEILEGPLVEGTQVVTRASSAGDTPTVKPATTSSPLMGPQPPRR